MGLGFGRRLLGTLARFISKRRLTHKSRIKLTDKKNILRPVRKTNKNRGSSTFPTSLLPWEYVRFDSAGAGHGVSINYEFKRENNASVPNNLVAAKDLGPLDFGPGREFWAYVDSFIQEQRSTHTKRAYEKDLLQFLTFMAHSNRPMNVHTLVTYRNRLETTPSAQTGKPLSRVTINRHMATIKSFLNWLVLNGVLPNNPARAVKSFRAGRESPTRDLPDDMVRRILLMPDCHSKSGLMHRAILMILFRLGLRRSELAALRTSDLFEESGMRVMRVRGKGDKERLLPLPKDVDSAIQAYLYAARKDPLVDQVLFTPVKNNSTKVLDKELNGNAIAFIVKKYAKKAGVTYRVSPHSARATAVSNALDHKAPHRAVQYMAGWSTPLMVTRYDKRKADLKNSAVPYVNYDSSRANQQTGSQEPEKEMVYETTDRRIIK